MATESAKIIIDAEDKASKKVAVAAANVEKSIKGIKDVSGKAKASTEFVGTLAASLGGSEVGAYAGQLAQLTERVSAFSEVSKAGGAGALAFKAGLVAAVGVIAFKFGNALGDMIFQTEKWNKELETATQRSKDLASALNSIQSGRYSDELDAVRSITDLDQKRIAAQEKLAELSSNLAAKERFIAETSKQISERTENWNTSLYKVSGNYRGITEQLKDQLAEAEAFLEAGMSQKQILLEIAAGEKDRLELARQQAEEKERLDASSASYVQSLRDELELLKASKDEVIAITAARNTTAGDQGEAEALLRERDAILARKQAEKEAEAERQANARKAEADRKRLESEQTRLIEQQASEAEALAKRMNADTSLTGTQGRLLTRGSGEDKQQKIVEHTKKTAEKLQQVYEELQELNRNTPSSSETLKLEVVD